MESLEKEADFSCAICLLMVCEPVQLKCYHVFCKFCLEKLRENDPNDFLCPLCRNPINLQFKILTSKTLENEFLTNTKEIYQKRLKEVENLRSEDNFFEKIKVFYGNTHEKEENLNNHNKHKWTFFVRGDTKSKFKIRDVIKKVEIELDPSFGGVSINLKGEPFEITRKGFAEFTLIFKIFWQKWLKLEPMTLFEYHLNFQKEISKRIHIIKINKELLKSILNKN